MRTKAVGSVPGSAPVGRFRRRAATGTEQARRKAWGQTWGRLLSDTAATLREKGDR